LLFGSGTFFLTLFGRMLTFQSQLVTYSDAEIYVVLFHHGSAIFLCLRGHVHVPSFFDISNL
jgi:hypothetical protein